MRFYLYASQEKNIKYFVEEKKKINWVQFQTMLGGGGVVYRIYRGLFKTMSFSFYRCSDIKQGEVVFERCIKRTT